MPTKALIEKPNGVHFDSDGNYVYVPTRFMMTDSFYDKSKADKAVNFIQALKHTKGKWYGKNFLLLPWQEQIIRDLFGTIKKSTGKRQFRTAYVEIPKKNGKSDLGAAIALYLLCADGERSAEVYGCAADRGQASLVYDVAEQMIDQDATLKRYVDVTKSKKEMKFLPLNGTYKVLSAEAFTKHGLNVSGVVFDELHTQPNRELFDIMTVGSGDAREQPLFFLITTAGDNTRSICYEVHSKAVDIMNGKKHDETFYPCVYYLPEDADWTNPKSWYLSNPSLGWTIDEETVRLACEQAKEDPAQENRFRQLRLNQWVKQAVRWMPMKKWEECGTPFDDEMLKGRSCYGGLDLSSTTDITAFSLVFPPEDESVDPNYYVKVWFWIPEECLDLRVKRDHVPYDIWKKQGYVTTTEGNVIHYAFIEQFINDLYEIYNIKEIAFDRWGATQMVQNLEADGFTVVPFGQGFVSMSPPTKELKVKVFNNTLKHGNNPVLNWMMDNAVCVKDPAGNEKLDKNKSTEKIDGCIAVIMALDRAIKKNDNTPPVFSGGITIF